MDEFYNVLPSEEDQSFIQDYLLDLIQTRDSNEFYMNLIVEPTTTFFPEIESSNLDCVWYSCRRLLDYAGLSFLSLDIKLVNKVNNSPVIAATFDGIEDYTCFFTVSKEVAKKLHTLLGVLAHEVAHAYRRFYRIENDNHALEEMLTDVTTIYLGFGVLTTRASYLVFDTRFDTYSSEAGYLSTELLTFGLAFQALLRGVKSTFDVGYLSHIGFRQCAFFREAFNLLLDQSHRFIIHIKKEKIVDSSFQAREIDMDPVMEIEEDIVEVLSENVYAYPFDTTFVWGLKSFLVCLILGLCFKFIFDSKLLLIIPVVISPIIGIYLSDLKKTYVCSNLTCSKPLDLTQEKCPICGGIIETVSVKDKDGFTHQVPREEWLQKFNNQQ